MPLITHPDGGKLLRTATGLAGSTDCCCEEFVCPDCGWFTGCFEGKEAHVRIEDIAAGDICDEAECDDFNTTYIIDPLDVHVTGGFCGVRGIGDLTPFACADAQVIVVLGEESSDAMARVTWGIPAADGITWEGVGCVIAEDLCAGIEVELTLVSSLNGLCTHDTARCFLQILP